MGSITWRDLFCNKIRRKIMITKEDARSMVTLRFNYEVRWYEFNLTERRSRRFITKTGALLYCFWLEHWHGAVAKIYTI